MAIFQIKNIKRIKIKKSNLQKIKPKKFLKHTVAILIIKIYKNNILKIQMKKINIIELNHIYKINRINNFKI